MLLVAFWPPRKPPEGLQEVQGWLLKAISGEGSERNGTVPPEASQKHPPGAVPLRAPPADGFPRPPGNLPTAFRRLAERAKGSQKHPQVFLLN